MITSFIITFRESLEAALIIGIILSYLVRTKQTRYKNTVYMGIVSALMVSILGALLFIHVSGGFEGTAEEIFEGIMMLLRAVLLTTMILWMMKQRHITKELEEKVEKEIFKAYEFGLFLLVFVSVLREGIETVIFLGVSSFVSVGNTLIGGVGGVIAAVFLGYLIFIGSKKINIKKFFTVTNIILILFAAGLTAHGVHELQEAGTVPIVIEHVWNINPSVSPDGGYPLLHEEGYIGSILKGLFGYNGNPSLIEVLSYLGYLALVLILWKNIEKIHKII